MGRLPCVNARGYFWGLVSAALGGAYFCTGSWLVRSAEGVSVREFTLVVYAWAALFAGVNALVTHRGTFRLAREEHRALFVLGGVWGVQVALAFQAARMMDAASAAAMFRTSLVFTLLLGHFVLGERLSRRELIPAAFIVAGVGVMLAGSTAGGTGPAIALGSAVFASAYQLGAKRALATVSPGVLNAYRNLYVCVVFGAMAIAVGWRPRPVSWTAHGAIALAAFLGPFLHAHAGLKAMARMPLQHAALVAQTQPLFVLLFAYLALGELPGRYGLLADALLLIGAAGLGAAAASKAAAGAPGSVKA